MAPPPSDPWNSNPEAVVRRKKNNGPPFKYLVILLYAPALPLIRLSLRHKPVLRDRLFYAALAGAFAHGGYLVYPFLEVLCDCVGATMLWFENLIIVWGCMISIYCLMV